MKQFSTIKIKKLHPDVETPKYATEGSSGFDLKIHNFKQWYQSENHLGYTTPASGTKNIYLTPHSRVFIGCGFSLEIPEGKELQVRSRSGASLKTGLIVLNSPGTVDSDYRGEIGAIICNTSKFGVFLNVGDSIAQAILCDYSCSIFEEVDDLSITKRGSGGFGSTNIESKASPLGGTHG